MPEIGTDVDALRPVALARPGSRVLLVGTSRHPAGSPLPDIDAVERSVEELAYVLHQRVGVPEANLRVLVNPPSPLEFGNAVKRAAEEADDTLLVHFTGHGLVGADDGLCLATCATDDLVDGLSWSVHTSTSPTLLATITPAAQTVQLSASFSPRSERLAVAASDSDSVVLYDTNPHRLADTLCSYTGNSITAAQWQKYAPGVPFQNPCPSRS
ncbi:hypothetical protein ABT173_16870 [Streptomyces sp. NPDC001795]|uniref:hypothetical protein n=1 Tax=Streptomyces sp. NPDC001795 TaxID=3154525 RepID=UPI00332ED9CE